MQKGVWNMEWNVKWCPIYSQIADLICGNNTHMWEVYMYHWKISRMFFLVFSFCFVSFFHPAVLRYAKIYRGFFFCFFFIWGSFYSHGSYSLIDTHMYPTADSLHMNSKVAHLFRGAFSLFTVYQLQLNPKPSSQSVSPISSQPAHVMCLSLNHLYMSQQNHLWNIQKYISNKPL